MTSSFAGDHRSRRGDDTKNDEERNKTDELSPLCPLWPPPPQGTTIIPPSAVSTDAPTRLSEALLYGSVGRNQENAFDDHHCRHADTERSAMNRTPSGGIFEMDAPTPPQRRSEPSLRALASAAAVVAPHLPFPGIAVISRLGSEDSSSQETSSHCIAMKLNGDGGVGWEANRRFKRQRVFKALRWASLAVVVAILAITTLRSFAGRQGHEEGGGTRPSTHTPTRPGVEPPPRSSSLSSFSLLDPVSHLGLNSHDRPMWSRPSAVFGPTRATSIEAVSATSSSSKTSETIATAVAKPTNAWYQNLLLVPDSDPDPSASNRVYSVPYLVDVVGPIPGVRVHPVEVTASTSVVRVEFVESQGLTLGVATKGGDVSKRYEISNSDALTPLGITLKWNENTLKRKNQHSGGDDGGIAQESQASSNDSFEMTSSIVRGMPYATARYRFAPSNTAAKPNHLPAVVSQLPIRSPPIVDGLRQLNCSSTAGPVVARSDVRLIFEESDFTWLVFLSRPAFVSCKEKDLTWEMGVERGESASFILRVEDVVADAEKEYSTNHGAPQDDKEIGADDMADIQGDDEVEEFLSDGEGVENKYNYLTVRIALVNNCTAGVNPIFCERGVARRDSKKYESLLKMHADVYPGENTRVEYEFFSHENEAKVDEDGTGATNAKTTAKTPRAARIKFDWDARSMSQDDGGGGGQGDDGSDDGRDLLMYALPHHSDVFAASPEESPKFAADEGLVFCQPSLIGPTCPVLGRTWTYVEPLPNLSFAAPRPPSPDLIPSLADALAQDAEGDIPDYFGRGAGDTYFSGKILARMGRVLMIWEELRGLKNRESANGGHDGRKLGATDPGASSLRGLTSADLSQSWIEYDPSEVDAPTLRLAAEAAEKVTLPSPTSFRAALDRLRSGVEIWFNGTAAAPFVYDAAWGGLVSCGCLFNGDTMSCNNAYPNCPAFDDPGLNFGNGFYNDHHFHYGYHILSAAVVAYFDPEWGRENFEKVLLYVRDIANPLPSTASRDGDGAVDPYFPVSRHKDWYSGHSWASGIAPSPPYLNGRNQESSSEAIAAYEAVGLYGDVMVRAFSSDKQSTGSGDESLIARATHVREVGRLLTATELRSADRYWHVRLEDDAYKAASAQSHVESSDSEAHKPESRAPAALYPEQYTEHAIGMMWNTMAQFQTWFGNAPFLAIGIQLLPLTAISEQRDDLLWAKNMYPSFAASCEASSVCTEQGWLVLQLAIFATVGHREAAAKVALSVPPDAFQSAGGNGHTLTNLLWYIATRPMVSDPLSVAEDPTPYRPPVADASDGASGGVAPSGILTLHDFNCGCPETCTLSVRQRDADGNTCADRMIWLMSALSLSEKNACLQVASLEYPDECGACNPDGCKAPEQDKNEPPACPPCPPQICHDGGKLNLCPVVHAPYLCTAGSSAGGCSRLPWKTASKGGSDCLECCELGPECQNNI